MKDSILALLGLLALAACQENAPTAAPPDPRMQPDGTCRANMIHPSLVSEYIPYGARCQVPRDSMRPHRDGSLHDSTYGAGVAYQTWTTSDGNCEPRAWAIDNMVNQAACLKDPPRWMYDTAYKMPAILTWGY